MFWGVEGLFGLEKNRKEEKREGEGRGEEETASSVYSRLHEASTVCWAVW